MIVCINHDHVGTPIIEYINYDIDDTPSQMLSACHILKESYEEVYLVPFDIRHEELIKEIQTKAVRI